MRTFDHRHCRGSLRQSHRSDGQDGHKWIDWSDRSVGGLGKLSLGKRESSNCWVRWVFVCAFVCDHVDIDVDRHRESKGRGDLGPLTFS